ncbi:DUF6940 family protein [Tundrisphaera lichenicola]|uniref:DUF6940 family protein n=1 Tax=Tundrisphaera lichenicola TaxID=2029860 RepID=UPI003EBCD964
MWTTRSERWDGGRLLKFEIVAGGSPLPFREALDLWRDEADFRTFFLGLLAEAPFSAFRWETPPVSDVTAARPFEFVLIDEPGLAGRSDPGAFADHFGATEPNREAIAFPNLGRDAILVVPRPIAPREAYGHLAAFVRKAPESQKHSLWALVGMAMIERLGKSPAWLSTAGAGVPWLHVRLDDRPKYYGFRPYRNFASWPVSVAR